MNGRGRQDYNAAEFSYGIDRRVYHVAGGDLEDGMKLSHAIVGLGAVIALPFAGLLRALRKIEDNNQRREK